VTKYELVLRDPAEEDDMLVMVVSLGPVVDAFDLTKIGDVAVLIETLAMRIRDREGTEE
jgi:hypothetical protein